MFSEEDFVCLFFLKGIVKKYASVDAAKENYGWRIETRAFPH
jgi:hypothetical protein